MTTDPVFITGIGFDFHRLVEGRELILGGVQIPYAKGLLGHSDADVPVHAICDALLGACGLDDIGIHFPDDDPAYKGIASLELLTKTCALVVANGYRIVNATLPGSVAPGMENSGFRTDSKRMKIPGHYSDTRGVGSPRATARTGRWKEEDNCFRSSPSRCTGGTIGTRSGNSPAGSPR